MVCAVIFSSLYTFGGKWLLHDAKCRKDNQSVAKPVMLVHFLETLV